MAEKIEKGMLVRVGTDEKKDIPIPIRTMTEGRTYERVKVLSPGHFLFGSVGGIYTEEKEVTKPVLSEEGEVLLDDNGNIETEVVKPAKLVALVQWAGPKYRTSILPMEMLMPAVKQSEPVPETIIVPPVPVEEPKKRAPRRRKAVATTTQ